MLAAAVVIAGCDGSGGSTAEVDLGGVARDGGADGGARDGARPDGQTPDAARGGDAGPTADGAPPRDAAPTADGAPADAGPDAVPPPVDAAPPDAAPPPVDAAHVDAAPPPVDAAPPPVDAAPPPVDAAPPAPVDAAAPPVDAAPPPPVDAAPPPPVDAAPEDAAPPPDAAVAEADATPHDPGPPPLLPPLITEIAARGALPDEDGAASDWIEIHNPNGAPFDLGGWRLADAPDERRPWTFPAGATIPPRGYLVVFASGKDRRFAGLPLHTDFQLAAEGDYLALLTPDGEVVHDLNGWPPQIASATFGFTTRIDATPLVGPGDVARWAVPTLEGALDAVFTDPDLDDAAAPWQAGLVGLGRDRAPLPRAMVQLADSIADFSGRQGQAGWFYGYWNAGADADGRYAPATDFTPFPWGQGGAGPGNFWDGARWKWFDGDPPFTELNATGARPNGANNGALHWAVRRWVSPVADRVRITGTLNNPAVNGDGVVGRILVDGVEVFAGAVNGSSMPYDVQAEVTEGAAVDFAIDPGPAGNDLGDGTAFTARIVLPGRAADALGPVLADSVADWSADGQQGHAGWTYGWFDRSADGDGAFAPDDFRPFPGDGGPWSAVNFWSGASWDWFGGSPPFTGVGREEMHPSGVNSGAEHWAVRRWTSDVEGTVVVRWRVAKSVPDGGGLTGRVFFEGRPVDAVAIDGSDFVGASREVVLEDVRIGDRIDFAIDPTGPGGDPADVADGAVLTATIHGAAAFGPYIATDVGDADGLWVRLPFSVDDPARIEGLRLRMRYDDGFAAWLNGAPVAADRAPDPPAPGAAATEDRPTAEAVVPVELDVPRDALRPGLNVLAIQVFDGPADDGRLLVEPALEAQARTFDTARPRYLPVPTPGADNVADGELGPLLGSVTRDPAVAPGEPIEVVAHVYETLAPVTGVTLTWRVRFDAEVTVAMEPDGEHRYTATIPGDVAAPGELVRWAVTATDARGATSRAPAFADPLDSERYYGTVVDDPSLRSELPVLHWFMEFPDQAATVNGGRATFWFDGELYDNTRVDIHGQSTRGFPKKSHDVDLPQDHRFRLRDDLPRMKDFNLLTNYADKSKLRNTLGHEAFRRSGHEHHLALPMRVHRNGQFYAVYELVEDPDERWIERLGLPLPAGSLYKVYDNLVDPNRSEKKTRRDEDRSDLQSFIAGLRLDAASRRTFIFDHVNLARMANFLAMMFVIQHVDCCHKNYYVYRDTGRTDEWWMFPWDVDLSFGRVWTGNYFDDTMYYERPFLGRGAGAVNTLMTALFESPEFMEMFYRRTRTVVDEILGLPGGAWPLEPFIDDYVARMRADADQDNASWATWGQRQTFDEGVANLKNGYLARRPQYVDRLAQPGAAVQVLLSADELVRWRVPLDDDPAWVAPDFDDAGWDEGAQGLGYEEGPARYAALLLTETRPPDADPAATTVQARARFTVDDPAAVARLFLRVRYDDGYVAWLNGVEVARRNLQGAPAWNALAADHPDVAAARWEDVDLGAGAARLRAGENVLAVQVFDSAADPGDLLLAFEVVSGAPGGGGPLPGPQSPDAVVQIAAFDPAPGEAHVLVTNPGEDAVDVSGWRLAGGGIEHVFDPGTVLPARGVLHVVADARAFRAANGGRALFVQGNWRGALQPDGAGLAVYDPQGRLRSP